MKKLNKWISLLLCAVILVGLLPTGVWAVDDAQDVTITETKTEEKTVYVLTDSIEAGKSYLIVNSNSAGSSRHALSNNNGSVGDTDVTIQSGITATGNQTYIELDDATATKTLWKFNPNANNSTFWDVGNGAKYLGHNDWNQLTIDGTSKSWSAVENVLYYTFTFLGTNYRYLCYDDGWTLSRSKKNVYFYAPTTATITTTTETTYSMRATDMLMVLDGSSLIAPLDFRLQANGVDLGDGALPANGKYEFTVISDSADIISSIAADGRITFTGEDGSATVQVAYTWKDGSGTVRSAYRNVTVTAELPDYSLELSRPYDTDNDGVYDNFDPITKPIVIKGVKEGQVSTELIWAVVKMNDEDLGDLDDDALVWTSSDPTIATVDTHSGEVTFTGAEGLVTITCSYEYADGKSVTDMVVFSVSQGNYIVPGDGTDDFPVYPDEGAVRFDKHATAVGSFNQTGIVQLELNMTGVPYTKGSEIDVVIMVDMSGSMDENGRDTAAKDAVITALNALVKNEDGTFNDNRVAIYTFASENYDGHNNTGCDLQTFNASSLSNMEKTINNWKVEGGTDYTYALKKCQNTLANAALEEGYDRRQFCIFVTDGAPTAGFTYLKNGQPVVKQGDGYEGDISLSECVQYDEYYSTLMKQSGVEVYSIGIQMDESGNEGTILKKIAGIQLDDADKTIVNATNTEYSNYARFVGTDVSELTTIFSEIVHEIKQAATNVKVEDKMGDDFFIIFEPPNDTVDGFDGDQEYYIEVGEYALNAVKDAEGNTVDYVRGGFTSFMKLYMGLNDGHTYYAATAANSTNDANKFATPVFEATGEDVVGYWTTDASKAEGGVSVVGADSKTYYFVKSGLKTGSGTTAYRMISGAYAYGTLTEDTESHLVTNHTSHDLMIATPYFVYNAATHILDWTADKLSETELVLRYFLYLERSGGYAECPTQNPSDTYYTNEYATLTYDNFQGNAVQQEFPVPQVTWNGAQVSYVFYLVNDKGQPVNRAGRVVPFSEAVYVTDVFTQSIHWNDLEQLESLDSELIAEDILPDVYELFDSNAKYTIHVFENEAGQNLNNHFVIEGTTDVVNTTYVFNSKSDIDKYSTPGTYAASKEFFCKDYNVTKNTDGTYTYHGNAADQYLNAEGEPEYGEDDIGFYTIARTSTDTTVSEGFDFANTTVAFAVRWKPQLVEDTVVIDYGLEVSLDVTTNDLSIGRAVGLLTEKPRDVNGKEVVMNTGTLDNLAFETETKVYLDGREIGIATISGSNVVFALNKQNGMQLTKPIVFYYVYEVNYYENNNVQELVTKYMYSSVTIIPATTVYYEENFVQFGVAGLHPKDEADNEILEYTSVTWGNDGTVTGTWQDTDRPGNDILSGADANNLYGYDSHYLECNTYSNGAAKKVTVNANTFATAEFTFYGTGFDLIGVTSNTTGTVIAEITDENGAFVRRIFVDTYYGYTKVTSAAVNEDGTSVVDENGDPVTVDTESTVNWQTETREPLYQVPVITARELTYGKYTVTITVSYNEQYDHNDKSKNEFYLDAVRIYDPTGVVSGTTVNKTVSDAYALDGEWSPNFEEIRNVLLTFYGSGSMADGATIQNFIDGNPVNTSVEDYKNYGPNNELYLGKGQNLVIDVDDTFVNNQNVADIQIGLKCANNKNLQVRIYNLVNGSQSNVKVISINTATDLFYSILDHYTGIVVIENITEDTVLSITNVKSTLKQTASQSIDDDKNPGGSEILSDAVENQEPGVVWTALAKFYIDVVIAVAGVFSDIEAILNTVYAVATAVI